jgi:hypothetical protein
VRVCLAGPMTGLPEYNYQAFRSVAAQWRADGHDVLDPSQKFNGRTDLPYEVYIKASIIDVLSADALAVLPGWNDSKGASLEHAIASALGYPIYDAMNGARLNG